MTTNLRIFRTHENGDLLLRFVIEWSTHDRDLVQQFGDPAIDVGGTFFEAAQLTAAFRPDNQGFDSVTVDFPGEPGTYSPQLPPTVEVTDPEGLGENALFSVELNDNGTIQTVTVVDSGSSYGPNSTVALTNDHVTTYPSQLVRLYSGFPYTRRINTIPANDDSLAHLAEAYEEHIITQVEAQLALLRGLPDLTGESVTQP
jgi:hypothetical protein